MLSLISNYRVDFLQNFFVFLNYTIYLYLICLVAYFFTKRKRRESVRVFFNAIVGGILVYFLKYLVGRPRPEFSVIKKIDPSFPSSHSFFSFMCVRFMVFRKKVKALSYFYLCFLIPFSLLYTSIHYPSDIIAGSLLGLTLPSILNEERCLKILHVFILLWRKVRKKISKNFTTISKKMVERLIKEIKKE